MLEIRPQTDADIDEVAALHLRTWQVGYAGILRRSPSISLRAAASRGVVR